MASGRDSRLLANLAEPLKPRRPPSYVQANPAGNPDGWYWVPEGADRAQYLGRNVLFAQQALLRLRQDAQAA